MSSPTCFLDYFTVELDKKLASLPTDRARVAVLAQQYGVWTAHYDRFAAFGHQPFSQPHPIFGDMIALDFANLLAMIDSKRGEIERVAA